ncbi:Hint domain-containing protein [Sulfitobacter pseudonitzschiae]|uniref:Hint domain-containing protein n=1 Tax=Pseudosulfitobacter pseudonitzschiae TaxID=1402135 RepID=A0A9Q2RV11_9RHOB|nr:Hint domain-containing protein [Pseudosulfitobacter pseudonitzschiae]MBM2291716.1 Hint domain-containing protein [Pseudosulfitobacter pseudonitzschiae]MBM2296634.1 Hint domain-containing protein [Pseudosulfitobacter pseudonitzschiae]MBM2301547.1 Hint domain-containing protein [Pseudosulfitobacter pseudonitzschiae]MBM2311331.1 Hint domain-containing protein [Pseudosulfitobacter pseudonitzschiae]MBM2316244.1 Hint domain-containing protein [Pseudosulfitobacter pseudonitzschiae]
MGTGFRGTFVISWSQTEIDGLEAAPMQSLNVGAAWSWYGDPVRVDGPSDILRLDGADGSENLRKRAARMVHRLVGAALDYTPADKVAWDDAAPLLDSSFVVTDGARTFTVTLIEVGRGAQPLLMFLNDIPPRNSDLWVVHHTLGANRGNPTGRDAGGVICFTPGTRIRTPDGPRLIEDLREGDLVQTKDSGAQPIEWVGSRPMTGARLFAMPHMRPVRIRAGALGVDRPDDSLLVSPEHRMLVQGDVAQALFNTPEVLVAAKDLINGRTITVDLQVPQTTYVHLMLPSHEILWANGVETESFHPASTALTTLASDDRARLLERFPDLDYDPHIYGRFARRNLSASEAAILRHAA